MTEKRKKKILPKSNQIAIQSDKEQSTADLAEIFDVTSGSESSTEQPQRFEDGMNRPEMTRKGDDSE